PPPTPTLFPYTTLFRSHGDHGPDADDDAEHGQQRAQLVGPQRLQRDPDDLAEQHGYCAAVLDSTITVSFSVSPLEKDTVIVLSRSEEHTSELQSPCNLV